MASAKPAGTIGYILRRFPVLSETFILNEILALEARGIPVHIFSLAPSRDPRVHEDLSRLKASVTYIPEVADLKTLLSSNLRAAACYRRQYLRALFYALTRGHSTVLWRFLQSGYVANQAQQLCLRQFHAHFATRPTSVALLTSMITGIPYSFTAHAYDIYESQVDPTALTQKIDRARWVITISEFNKAYLDQLSPAAAGKIVRIYNGIDLIRFVPNDMRPPLPFTILTVARLVEKKGLPVLIEACRHLRERDVPFRCWIVGKGRLRSQLEAMIARWSLHDYVCLLGSRTQGEVLERYWSAHLYVLPCVLGSDGNRDGLPVSIVEALACGLPVVTTPMTGIPEVVRNRYNGLLVPDGDPKVLADAIESVIQDAHLYECLRANARASVASTFDLGLTAAALQRLFEEE